MNIFLCIILIFIAILFLLFLITYFFLMDEPSVRVFYRTIGRDIRGMIKYLKIYFFMQYCRFRNLTVIDFFNQNVKRHPNKVCLVFEDEEWTYKQMDEFSNKIAHFFLLQGYREGDEVALFMENCPEYVCIWLGLGKIGVVTALINTKLKTESLAHCVNSIDIKGLIFGQNFVETFEKAMPYIRKANSTNFYCYSKKSEKSIPSFPCKDLNVHLENVAALPVDLKMFKNDYSGKLIYIYTSGTTGMPKAAIITHRRYLHCARSIYSVVSSYEPRVVYNSLPLYHIASGVFHLGVILIFGGKMVITKKFSASNFWKDIVKHKVSQELLKLVRKKKETIHIHYVCYIEKQCDDIWIVRFARHVEGKKFKWLICVYIGEICRYLLNQPNVAEETQHSLQLMVGNGLSSEVWKKLQERFRINNIVEVYGSTEGNIAVANFSGKVGAVGFITRNFQKIQGVYLIQVHPENGEIIRDINGLCIRCKPGETGQLVGKISNSHPITKFDGYINAAESRKKIIRNCFQKGDMVFASGDIFVMDEDGFLYFKDRFGDTFRWKGENVSSTEVENILSKLLDFASCIVYGVEIPGNDGRIGMAAVQTEDLNKINFDRLYKDISERLPAYAIPAFLRISNALEATGTYKLMKVSFQKQGYNPEIIDDPLYVQDIKKRTFFPLTREIYCDILKGTVKF